MKYENISNIPFSEEIKENDVFLLATNEEGKTVWKKTTKEDLLKHKHELAGRSIISETVSLKNITTPTDTYFESVVITENEISSASCECNVDFKGNAELEISFSSEESECYGRLLIDGKEYKVWEEANKNDVFTFKGEIFEGITVIISFGTVTFNKFIAESSNGFMTAKQARKLDDLYTKENRIDLVLSLIEEYDDGDLEPYTTSKLWNMFLSTKNGDFQGWKTRKNTDGENLPFEITNSFADWNSQMIDIPEDIAPTSCYGMFYRNHNLLEIPKNIDFSNATNIGALCNRCSQLKSIDSVNAKSATSAAYMLEDCYNLEYFRSFSKTGNILNYTGAFRRCYNLKFIGFDMESIVADIDFSDCSMLTIRGIDTIIEALFTGAGKTVVFSKASAILYQHKKGEPIQNNVENKGWNCLISNEDREDDYEEPFQYALKKLLSLKRNNDDFTPIASVSSSEVKLSTDNTSVETNDDENGWEITENQLFAKYNPLFTNGVKFIIKETGNIDFIVKAKSLANYALTDSDVYIKVDGVNLVPNESKGAEFSYSFNGNVEESIEVFGKFIEFTFENFIKNEESDGFMSGEDKEKLDNLEEKVGSIDTALDAILAIQESIIGGVEQ